MLKQKKALNLSFFFSSNIRCNKTGMINLAFAEKMGGRSNKDERSQEKGNMNSAREAYKVELQKILTEEQYKTYTS